jgi:hypothetical protein
MKIITHIQSLTYHTRQPTVNTVTSVQNAQCVISVSLTPELREAQFKKHWHKFSFSVGMHQKNPETDVKGFFF